MNTRELTTNAPVQLYPRIATPPSARELRPVTTIGARSPCSACRLRHICLPQELDEEMLSALDNLLIGKRRVKRGQHLYYEGDRLQFLYAVRVGSFKSSMTLTDGREHVMGFSFTGELLGFDALSGDTHTVTAVALEDSEVCAIPYEPLMALAANGSGSLQRRVHRMLGVEMLRDHHLMTLLASTNAEPRVGAFLLLVAQRLAQRGYSQSEFVLRMSRAEIGSYLGLTLETVSRALSAFDKRGWVQVTKRRVRLVDPDAIVQVCDSALPGISRNFAQWQGGSPPPRGNQSRLEA